MSFLDGVTNMTSFPAFWALSPYSWTSGYGNQMQFNIMNTSIPEHIAYMAQNCMNPSFWAYYNYSAMANPFIFQGGNNMAYQTLDPRTLQMAYQNAYDSTMQAIQGSRVQASFTSAANSIATLKADIDAMLKTENLPADKKQKLEALKEKIAELEENFKKLAENREGLPLNQIQEKLEAYRGALAAIEDTVKELKESLTPQPTDATEPTAATTATTPTTPTTATAATTPTTPTTATTPTEPTETVDELTPEEEAALAKSQAQSITKDIYVAVEGIGTDNEKLETAIASITPANVVEVFDAWAANDYNGKTGDDSLMETIYDDVFGGETRKKYTMHILNAFIERANAEGIDISAEQAVIEAELGKWWRNDGLIYETMDAIHAKLTNGGLAAVA